MLLQLTRLIIAPVACWRTACFAPVWEEGGRGVMPEPLLRLSAYWPASNLPRHLLEKLGKLLD